MRSLHHAPWPTVSRSVWATPAVPSRPPFSGPSLLLSTLLRMTMVALPLAQLCHGSPVPLVLLSPRTRIPMLLIVFCVRVRLHVDGYEFRPNLLSAAYPPACSRLRLNKRNGPERSPAAAPGWVPGPLLLYDGSLLRAYSASLPSRRSAGTMPWHQGLRL